MDDKKVIDGLQFELDYARRNHMASARVICGMLEAGLKIIEDQKERIDIMSEGGWIPVSQLPGDESDVLLYGEGKGIIIAYYSDGVWYDNQHNHLRNRTHWMPLPEPPKEGEQK